MQADVDFKGDMMPTIRLSMAYPIIVAIVLLIILDSLIQLFLPIIIPDVDWSIFRFTDWFFGVVKAAIEFTLHMVKIPFVLIGVITTVVTVNTGITEVVKCLQLFADLLMAFIGVFLELAAISMVTIILRWIFPSGGGEEAAEDFSRRFSRH